MARYQNVEVRRIEGLDDVLRKLKALPPELVSKRGGPVAAALRKGGRVISKQWVKNIEAIVAEPNVDGLPSQSTGLLAKSVTVSRSSARYHQPGVEQVRVRVKNVKYPDAPGVTTGKVGRLLENGSEKMAAKRWASKGFMTSREQALSTIVAELNAGIARVIRKMERSK